MIFVDLEHDIRFGEALQAREHGNNEVPGQKCDSEEERRDGDATTGTVVVVSGKESSGRGQVLYT